MIVNVVDGNVVVDGTPVPSDTSSSRMVVVSARTVLKVEPYTDQNAVEIQNLQRIPAEYAKHFPVLLDHGTFSTHGSWVLESKLSIDYHAMWTRERAETLRELVRLFNIEDVRATLNTTYAQNAGITPDGEVVIWDLGIAEFPELERAEVAGA